MSTNDIAAELMALRKESILRAMACDPGTLFRRIGNQVCSYDVNARRFNIGHSSTSKLSTATDLCTT